MKFRFALVAVVLIGCTIAGGLYGFVAGIVLLGILGVLFPAPVDTEAIREAQEAQYEKIIPARRGSEVDPTRPTPADYKAMKEFHRERYS